MSQNSYECPYGNRTEPCRWREIPGKVRDEKNVGILECADCQMKKHSVDLRQKINYASGSMHEWTRGYGEEFKGPSEDKDRRVRAVQDLMKKNSINSILDFGCGNGEMLEVFDSKLNKTVKGLEPENNARLIAQKRGFEVASSISEYRDQSEKFDLVTLFHVIEHLYDPINQLIEIKSVLKQDSFLIIETPNSQDALISIYECEAFRNFTYWSHHPFLYSNLSLGTLLESAGFEVVLNTGTQRYSLDNHLYWLSKEKPGGHEMWRDMFNQELLEAYNESLVQKKSQDTLWLVAKKRA
jgi:2-polyprenyl-3-methyl-5-hydroxy-6-metoxy-1,4-benzoquinol methylase